MTLINKKKKKFLILAIVCIISAVSFSQKKVSLKAGTIIPLQSVAQVKAADVNANGEVNIADLAHFKQYVSKEAVVLGPQN